MIESLRMYTPTIEKFPLESRIFEISQLHLDFVVTRASHYESVLWTLMYSVTLSFAGMYFESVVTLFILIKVSWKLLMHKAN